VVVVLTVRRAKNGKPAAHPIRGDELHKLKAETESPPVFATERGGPFTTDAVNRLIKRIGARAGLPFPVHVHMLATPAAISWPMTTMIPGYSGLARPPFDPAYGALYGIEPAAVQGLLARLRGSLCLLFINQSNTAVASPTVLQDRLALPDAVPFFGSFL
jgi:hypothetical protein